MTRPEPSTPFRLADPTRRVVTLGAAALLIAPSASRAAGPDLAASIASPQRNERNRARDVWRRPAETIAFLGIEPQHHVVEILPGSGAYWLEILAPYLRDRGLYIAADRDENAPPAIRPTTRSFSPNSPPIPHATGR